MTPDSIGSFFEFLKSAQFRFYQERDVLLDLYQDGIGGITVGVLGVSSAVVFLLAIFHLIPVRRHVVLLLTGLGVTTTLIGLASSYWHFLELDSDDAGLILAPAPSSEGQLAAVVALPLVVGAVTLAANLLGCLYVAVFWGASRLKKPSPEKLH